MGDILQLNPGQWLLLHPEVPARNMALVARVDPVESADRDIELALTYADGSIEFHGGDEAQRIRHWLARHGELPPLDTGPVAPGAAPESRET